MRYLCELPLARGVDPGASDALMGAVGHRHAAVVRYLCKLPLERGVHPGARDNAALQLAAEKGCVATIHTLCALPPERGVHPGVADNIVLQTAVRNGHHRAVRYLCELPPERGVDPFDEKALEYAQWQERDDIVTELRYTMRFRRHRVLST